MNPDPSLIDRVARLCRRKPTSFFRIERGYTPAERWRVTFADGSSAFAKMAVTAATAAWLRAEHEFHARVREEFVPQFLGFSDHPERPLLLLEDLSLGHWPPPWRPRDVERLRDALQLLAQTRAPGGWPELELDRARFAGWLSIERDPGPFLSLGACTPDWLAGALPSLLMAQDLAVLDGASLIHGDIRSDNICIRNERVLFLDWNHSRRGNAVFDAAGLAPSLRLEGGPLPDELVPGEGPLAALIAGYLAANAGLPALPEAPRMRWLQLRQLRIALPWAARALGLPPPNGAWPRQTLAQLDGELARGALDEAAWYAETEEVIGDAYLASADPRAQSGKSGDEIEWRWSRELVLDALPEGSGPFDVLDVGCANGYLMESLQRWGRERGVAVEPHGLEISERLAELARQRLPDWAARIATGNLLAWAAPRRYDLVHTALDYIPPARRRESLEHIARELLTPRGRIVLRPERVGGREPDPVAALEALGLPIGRVLERAHPSSGELRRTAWLSPPRRHHQGEHHD